MSYLGEHTFIGQLGHAFVILSFVFSGIATLFYFLSVKSTANLSYLKSARIAFFAHVITSLVFMGLIFFMLIKHYYEYEYIWEQSSENMSFRYLLVCFWGGQQGSFMLWIFWHLVLGTILIFSSKKYEPYVMTIFCLAQLLLLSMLLGVYIGSLKIGSSPFALRRDVNTTFGPLWNLIPDYFTYDNHLQSGKGLNPLLRNYWMTIHPPTLFLGFALTLVPFCYAIAALWKKQLTEWIKHALPWTFLGIMVLGAGILMGGKWAYESLSFGGFWAWDPVENASLVPWIILLGAGHLMLINKNKPGSLFSTFLFTAFSFILVLLSTFLTRSGILGDSSVHSFAGDDMLGQLLLYLLFFIWLTVHLLLNDIGLKRIFGVFSICLLLFVIAFDGNSILFTYGNTIITLKAFVFCIASMGIISFLIIGYSSTFPKSKDSDENLSAREFWMFLASIVLLLSAFHIIYNTCLPVINTIFGTKSVISQDDRNSFYNTFQIPFAILIALLMSFSQFLKYRKTQPKLFIQQIALSFILTCIIAIPLIMYFDFSDYIPNGFLLFTAIFSILANLDFYIRLMHFNNKQLGSSLAHAGFGLLLVGALISQAKQTVISKNYKGYYLDFLDKDGGIKNQEDVQLFKGELTSLADYFVVFKNKHLDNDHLVFDIDYIEQLPFAYKKGERVRYNYSVFECNTDHKAHNNFVNEKNYWKPLKINSTDEFYNYPLWESAKPGKTLFTLHPFVQVNNMGNIAEPGTKNFWNYDIFTHIKYADLSPNSNGKMLPFKLKGKLGDTLWTAGFKIVLEDATRFNDSLQSNSIGLKLRLKFIEILDRSAKFPIYAEPTYLIDSVGNIKNELYHLKKHGIDTKITLVVPGDVNNNNQGTFEFELTTPEYIVLHARVFPYITLLWWGCIIMCIGTIYAVFYQIKALKIARKEEK